MKINVDIPSQKDLLASYNLLQGGPLSEVMIRSTLDQIRFDPRLAEIMVDAVAKQWRNINPMQLNSHLQRTAWPAAFGVVLENAQLLVPTEDQKEFQRWMKVAMLGIPKANGEQFWIGLYLFSGKMAREQMASAIKSYLRWGFLGRDVLINKVSAMKFSKTIIPKKQRMKRLRALAEHTPRFTARDYLAELDFQVSQRVAELDLSEARFLKPEGNTKGRYYRFMGRRGSVKSLK